VLVVNQTQLQCLFSPSIIEDNIQYSIVISRFIS
jgi:hypothetical protein